MISEMQEDLRFSGNGQKSCHKFNNDSQLLKSLIMKMIIRTHTGFVAYFVKLASDASTNVFLGFLCNFRYSNFLNIFDFVRHVPPMQEKISTLSYSGFSRACAGCMFFRAYPDCLFSLAFPRFFALDASSFYLRRIMMDVTKTGNGERGTGNGRLGTSVQR